jgi:hypothetical protein
MKLEGSKRARHRAHLFLEQGGRCFWCRCKMVLPRQTVSVSCPNVCTIDHLYDRRDPNRATQHVYGERRHVASCFRCNQRRSSQSVEANNEEYRRRCAEDQDLAILHSAQPAAANTQVMTT